MFEISSYSVQFSSVAQSCLALCDPMNHSMPGLPVHHQLPEFTQTHVHRVSDAIQPSPPLSSPSTPAPIPSQHQSFPMSQLFTWGGQSTGVSALASFLPKKFQGWSPSECILILSSHFVWKLDKYSYVFLKMLNRKKLRRVTKSPTASSSSCLYESTQTLEY